MVKVKVELEPDTDAILACDGSIAEESSQADSDETVQQDHGQWLEDMFEAPTVVDGRRPTLEQVAFDIWYSDFLTMY